MKPLLEEENPELKPIKLRLKTEFLSHPARLMRLGKFIKENSFPNIRFHF